MDIFINSECICLQPLQQVLLFCKTRGSNPMFQLKLSTIINILIHSQSNYPKNPVIPGRLRKRRPAVLYIGLFSVKLCRSVAVSNSTFEYAGKVCT